MIQETGQSVDNGTGQLGNNNDRDPGYVLEGNGTPVVMLHSSMSSRSQWRPLRQKLNDRFQTLAVDLYGYGAGPIDFDIESFALEQELQWLLSVLENTIPGRRFHLIGHSYGGVVAMGLARRHGERVISLSLYEPVAFHLLDRNSEACRQVLAVVESIVHEHGRNNDRRGAELFVDYWNGQGFFQGLPRRMQTVLTGQVVKVLADFHALFYEPACLADYRVINNPVLLMQGVHSPLSTRTLVALLQACWPFAEHREIHGGHMAPVQQADTVADEIVAFLVNFHDKEQTWK